MRSGICCFSGAPLCKWTGKRNSLTICGSAFANTHFSDCAAIKSRPYSSRCYYLKCECSFIGGPWARESTCTATLSYTAVCDSLKWFNLCPYCVSCAATNRSTVRCNWFSFFVWILAESQQLFLLMSTHLFRSNVKWNCLLCWREKRANNQLNWFKVRS